MCLCVAKYLVIDDADRALVVDLACQPPAGLSYAAEPGASDLTWTHARKTAEAAGQPRLATLSCGAARDILADAQTEPHRMVHCRERCNSVHKCPKTVPRGHFSRSVYTPASPRLSTTAQQCTQTPQNGSKRPFSPICVHSCVTALAVTPTPPGR